MKKLHIYINNNYICTTNIYKTIKEAKTSILKAGKITTYTTAGGNVPADFKRFSKTYIIKPGDALKIATK